MSRLGGEFMPRLDKGDSLFMNGRGVSVDFIKENMSFTAGIKDSRSNLMFAMLSVSVPVIRKAT